MVEQAILRIADVRAATGLSRATVWRMVKAGTFPAPVALGKRAIGWRREAVESWVEGLQEKAA